MKHEAFKRIIICQKGEGLLTAFYTMFVISIIFFIGVDIAGYTVVSWKLQNACSETLALMKIENGFDARIEEAFYEFLAVQGFSGEGIEVEGTPKLVQRGDQVSIRAKIPYELKSLRPLGHSMELDIVVELSGLAQDFVR